MESSYALHVEQPEIIDEST